MQAACVPANTIGLISCIDNLILSHEKNVVKVLCDLIHAV